MNYIFAIPSIPNINNKNNTSGVYSAALDELVLPLQVVSAADVIPSKYALGKS